MNFSLIIPLRDEEKNIERLKKEVSNALDNIKDIGEYEIICIDDGSKDSTLKKLSAIKNKRFKVISFEKGAGQSAAISEGIKQAKYDTLGIIDADLQTDPKEFEMLIDIKNKEGYNCVTGSRVKRNDNFSKRFSTWFARKTRQIVLKDDFYDITCPLKVVDKVCLSNITFYDTFHRYVPFLVQMQDYTVKQVPISHYPRIAGKTHYGVINRFWVGIKSMFVVKWMSNNYLKYKTK